MLSAVSVPDLGLVAVFVKVVELESFTAAASALGLPKSSVSRSVAQLEEGLGVRLLQRTSRKLSLTDAGRGFFDRVREPLNGVVDALDSAAESSRAPSGIIRITAPPDLGYTLLAAPLAEFLIEHPQIKIDLSLTSRVVDLVQERFDLALRATERGLEDSTLVARRLGGPRTGLFASPAYLKRRGKPRTAAELAEHDCILFRAHDGRTVWRLQGSKGEERVTVSGPINVDDINFVRRAVAEGAGIGTLPVIAESEAVRVLPDYTLPGGALFLVMPSGRHVPARVALLRDFLIDKLKSACTE